MKSYNFFILIFKKFWLVLIGNLLLLLLAGLAAAFSVFTIGPLIDFLANPDLKDSSSITLQISSALEWIGIPVNLLSFLAVFLVFQVFKNGFNILSYHMVFRTKYLILRELMLGSFEDFFNARWQFFSSSKQGTLLNSFTREIVYIGDAIAAMLLLCTHFIQVGFYLVVPLYISWQVTSISMAAACVVSIPFLLLGRLSYRLGQANTDTGNDMVTVVQENMSLAKVILGFGNQHKSLDRLAHTFDAHRTVTIKTQTLRIATPYMYEPLGLLVIAGAILLGRRLGVSLAELAIILWAFRSTIPLIGSILANKNALLSFLPSFEQIQSLRQQASVMAQRTGSLEFEGFETEMSFLNVSFSYPGQKETLNNLNLKIRKGMMTAIVGESGTGKSTLIDLIMALNEPQHGQICIDGTPLPNFNITTYRQKIGYVPQDSILFDMTIRENLLWAHDRATELEIKQACELANADEFIRSFPDNYDTFVGDRGVRLSGGQRQRIALARAILRKPELLILDEATSSLDTQSERSIQDAIEKISQQTTVVVVAHRLSTISKADYVYVLGNGQIIEEGPYDSLIKKSGHLNNMIRLQTLDIADKKSE